MHAADKKLNEMNRLADMGHFPVAVHAGATLNVLLTVSVTWWLQARWPAPSLQTSPWSPLWVPLAWVAAVLAVNLLPVCLLRLTLKPGTIYPTLPEMDFFRDQHKFSDWVYVAASANMAFWVLGAWAVFSLNRSPPVLAAVLGVAALATFSPVLLRRG